MDNLELTIIILFIHFISDFIFQSDWMAQNKSKRNLPLLIHVVVYSIPFTFFGVEFALANCVLHFCVDYVTSRISSKLYKQGKIHWFFVVIGFDQWIHAASLLLTARYFGIL